MGGSADQKSQHPPATTRRIHRGNKAPEGGTQDPRRYFPVAKRHAKATTERSRRARNPRHDTVPKSWKKESSTNHGTGKSRPRTHGKLRTSSSKGEHPLYGDEHGGNHRCHRSRATWSVGDPTRLRGNVRRTTSANNTPATTLGNSSPPITTMSGRMDTSTTNGQYRRRRVTIIAVK